RNYSGCVCIGSVWSNLSLMLRVDTNSGGIAARHIRRPPHYGYVFGVRNFRGSNLCVGSQHQLAFSGTDPDRNRLCAGVHGRDCVYIQALACRAFRRHLRARFGDQQGMILSATPLAWFIDRWSWRSGFVVLTIMSLVTLLASALVLEKTVVNHSRSLAREILSAFYDLRLVLFGRRPIALLALGFVTYGALITIRGLWI